MSRKDAVVIACRVMSIYFLIWALDVVTYLPDQILSAYHYGGLGGNMAERTYLFRHYIIAIIFVILRFVAFACLSLWFYLHPPELQNLLLPAEEATKAE